MWFNIVVIYTSYTLLGAIIIDIDFQDYTSHSASVDSNVWPNLGGFMNENITLGHVRHYQSGTNECTPRRHSPKTSE
jgi:hypothetical protein